MLKKSLLLFIAPVFIITLPMPMLSENDEALYRLSEALEMLVSDWRDVDAAWAAKMITADIIASANELERKDRESKDLERERSEEEKRQEVERMRLEQEKLANEERARKEKERLEKLKKDLPKTESRARKLRIIYKSLTGGNGYLLQKDVDILVGVLKRHNIPGEPIFIGELEICDKSGRESKCDLPKGWQMDTRYKTLIVYRDFDDGYPNIIFDSDGAFPYMNDKKIFRPNNICLIHMTSPSRFHSTDEIDNPYLIPILEKVKRKISGQQVSMVFLMAPDEMKKMLLKTVYMSQGLPHWPLRLDPFTTAPEDYELLHFSWPDDSDLSGCCPAWTSKGYKGVTGNELPKTFYEWLLVD